MHSCRDAASYEFCRTIRDPIYGYIPITKLENQIIDTAEFQRLDRISQVHSVHFVYPNAKYSRKCHSLGVMHLIHRAFSAIIYRQNEKLNSEIHGLFFKEPSFGRWEKLDDLSGICSTIDANAQHKLPWIAQCVRLAGLLHDIGHAPFSHLFETVCRSEGIPFNHEKMSRLIIKNKFCDGLNIIDQETASFVCNILAGFDNLSGNKLSGNLSFLHDLISSPMDCDKMDYLVRDSYHAGTAELGMLDVNRMIDGFVVQDGELKIKQNHVNALLDFFHSYLYMYTSVYNHPTCRLFDLTLSDAFRCRRVLLENIAEDYRNLLRYDDVTFLWELVSGDEGARPKEVINMVFARRKVYKRLVTEKMNLPVRWVYGHGELYSEMLDGMEMEEEDYLKTSLKSIEDYFLEEFEEYSLVLDIVPQIRSIGTRPEKIINWLCRKKIFDVETQTAKRLSQVESADYDRLLKIQIPINIFCPKERYDQLSDKEKIKIKEKASKIIKEKVAAAEKEIEGSTGLN